MGANATGKTSLGKALLRIFAYMENEMPSSLFEMVSGETGCFCIDFINEDYRLQRLCATICPAKNDVEIRYFAADIDCMDSYEKCVSKLKNFTAEATQKISSLKEMIGDIQYRFAYPEIKK